MKSFHFPRKDGEPAQIAFDRVSRFLRRLFAIRYGNALNAKAIHPGKFAIETLPGAGGWKVTVNALPQDAEAINALAA